MLAILLGLSWLVLTPVCVWLLFGRHRAASLRVLAGVTLTGLQAATMAYGFIEEPLTREAVLTPRPAARAGAPGALPVLPLPPAAAAQPSAGDDCASRMLAPEAVRLSLRGRVLHGITLYWPASFAECGTAAVALHHDGGRLRLWLHEGTPSRYHEGLQTVPVHVNGGTASLDLRLTQPIRHHRRYVAINGHTGRRIPQRHGA
ncbi:hypothetical protein [Microbispora sp. ATCC PTA-5024]|uniref:hypothetical protein n=1 Tax=Microbispora sp. ATCC PTA-5024 TaxID=316330 RepID=UPI0003DBA491|nr:hypothetical protein [Microbispora sp. ATCC PTA-5024]ETK33879.1 hypothetical protein MPTA5024_22235 [Microbispora sp. ATCC PTA-5024]